MILPIPTLCFFYRIIIGTHITCSHQTIGIKFQMLVTMATHPLTWISRIPTFIFKSHRNAIFCITPKFLHEMIIKFLVPFTLKKPYDIFSTSKEPCTVAPSRIWSISLCHHLLVTYVFQASCATLTFSFAVSSLKGGLIGAVAMVIYDFYNIYDRYT
jgi:hypothetical protein